MRSEIVEELQQRLRDCYELIQRILARLWVLQVQHLRAELIDRRFDFRLQGRELFLW